MNVEELTRRITDFEDGWTERKEQGVSTEDIRKTIVAFANSVPATEEAVLFFGIADSGEIKGVDNPESLQQKVIPRAVNGCYPPISYLIQGIRVNEKNIVALIVQSSYDKPHFTGKAYIRVGSRNEDASKTEFTQLIASRNSKAYPLLEAMRKNEKVSLFYWSLGRNNKTVGATPLLNCEIVECTPQYVTFQPTTGHSISSDFDHISITKNSYGPELRIDIDA